MNFLGLGTTRLDFNLYIEELLIDRGNEAKIRDKTLKLGGSVLNTSVILKYLGALTTFYTELGDDLLGNFVQSKIKEYGLSIITPKEKVKESATSYILVTPDGERTIYSHDPTQLKIDETVQLLLAAKNANALFTSIYEVNDNNLQQIIRLMEMSQQKNKKNFLDLSPTIELVRINVLKEILHFTNILIGTEQEINKLMSTFNFTSIQQIINTFQIKKIYIKKGSNGSKLVGENGKEVSAKGVPVEVKNVTGCGDAYNAGVIFGEVNGLSEEKTLQLANYLGGKVAKHTFIPEKVILGYKEIIK